jgi:hypothetical protein
MTNIETRKKREQNHSLEEGPKASISERNNKKGIAKRSFASEREWYLLM